MATPAGRPADLLSGAQRGICHEDRPRLECPAVRRRLRTRFQIRRSSLDNYDVRQVGGQTILEYWIPAEDLAALNASIVGTIEVTAEFH
jgi:hypothetical protein